MLIYLEAVRNEMLLNFFHCHRIDTGNASHKTHARHRMAHTCTSIHTAKSDAVDNTEMLVKSLLFNIFVRDFQYFCLEVGYL